MATGDDERAATLLASGYDEDDAGRDRRDLETLEATDVSWRVKRRLRHRVGDEDELRARLAAWDANRPAPPASPREVLQVAAADAIGLAREYRDVCRHVWGDEHPDVLANADRIARGDVLPWDARHVIEAERTRAEEFRQRSAQLAAVASARPPVAGVDERRIDVDVSARV